MKFGSVDVVNYPGTLLLPDIDVYFQGRTEQGMALIDGIAKAELPCVKLAALHDADMCLPNQTTQYFVPGKGMIEEDYRQLIERHVVPLDVLNKLIHYAQSLKLEVLLSVYDQAGLDLAIRTGVVGLKIPSSNIVHAPLIRAAAQTGIPLIIDTGRSTLEEIDRAVAWAKTAGVKDLVVQHSPPGPPATDADAQLNVALHLADRYGSISSLSDHSSGNQMLRTAAAMGIKIVEKGLSWDDNKTDIDLAHAMPLDQLGAVVNDLKQIATAKGSGGLELWAQNRKKRNAPPRDRMGLCAKNFLPHGSNLTLDKVQFSFPATGIPVEQWDAKQGLVTVKDIPGGQPIMEDDLEH